MVREFKPAVNVSPLIRFGRWSFLVLGITYGATFQSIFQRKEDKGREVREKARAERNAKIAEEKARYLQVDMDNLNAIFNPPKTA
ncbi:ATP synthase, F0 complex, subunit E, mitochondrial [Cinara cedri]|uniref:ATP synthase F(0) complex subunit e, mitochondrial n=1 Tax=Cinara cedri TaxID=506608 RepID=A0A5E4NIK0_9HEMI|nr:ATP synthase, F0 complex, subunit E, mitochondrial [Cinara cedri]